ncbi:hypothetical protein L6773_01745 [Rhodohalobacter sp. WB101]|uniref:Uncharacterized protein n=1 Tax=Rhodohalobacter sulfatireducens TaxID=2911366 RepID=A0ABS9K8U3_9BACT|nr:hypothetical protein [Rhodohalobacter sulfatireducens]
MSNTRILIHNASSPIAIRQLTDGHSKNKPCIDQNVMGSSLIPRGLCPEVVH